MGLFSRVFGGKKSGGVVSGRNPGSGWVAANKFNRARGGYAGGYGAWTFGNIMNAHCTPETIVEEFGLNKEDNVYGCDAYLTAYQEEYDNAYKEYEDLMGFYMELIELNEGMILENEVEIAELEAENEELRLEIEELRDELDDMDSMEDMMEAVEIMEEIAELEAQIAENEARIEELHAENTRLNEEIMGWHAEMELYSVEDFINYDEVDKKAMDLACEFAQNWIDGNEWIPIDVLNWAYYDISDHNG